MNDRASDPSSGAPASKRSERAQRPAAAAVRRYMPHPVSSVPLAVPARLRAMPSGEQQLWDQIGGQMDGRWRTIRNLLERAPIGDGVRTRALAIFTALANAEAAVHGVDVDSVHFHEVGAWDSIADIVAASALLDALAIDRITVSSIPLGSGLIPSAHGWLPVPGPATARLLQGFRVHHDGLAGERITPTGAAILAALCKPEAVLRDGRLQGQGVGFGSRRLVGRPNCVRLVYSEPLPARGKHRPTENGAVTTVSKPEVRADRPDRSHSGTDDNKPTAGPTSWEALGLELRHLHFIEFDVDDQSPEDLSMGLDRLRQLEGVIEVVQVPQVGKKGRMMSAVRLLVAASSLEPVIERCFTETTTIGLRFGDVQSLALRRAFKEVTVDGQRIRVKSVERPGGVTAKAENDDLQSAPTRSVRDQWRSQAVNLALRISQPGLT